MQLAPESLKRRGLDCGRKVRRRDVKILKGSCLCGQVKIEVPDRFEYIGSCHCSECRKFSGAANATAGGIDGALLNMISGGESLSIYRKSENTELAFCRHCGSSLFSRKRDSGLCNLRLGILDDAPTQQPTFHIFVASKAPWEDICDDLPRFDGLPPTR